jgi:hypothetical protein
MVELRSSCLRSPAEDGAVVGFDRCENTGRTESAAAMRQSSPTTPRGNGRPGW